jgi:hypothetical protein
MMLNGDAKWDKCKYAAESEADRSRYMFKDIDVASHLTTHRELPSKRKAQLQELTARKVQVYLSK